MTPLEAAADTRTHVALTQAWSAWMAGIDIKAYVLWGVEILWWGRIGKLIQLLTVLLGLLELVGTARLSLFLQILAGETFSKKWVERHMQAYFYLWMLVFIYIVGPPYLSLAYPLVNPALMNSGDSLKHWIGAIVLLAPMFALAGIGFLLYHPFQKLVVALAHNLAHPRIVAVAKLIVFALFLVGFHFDLLSS